MHLAFDGEIILPMSSWVSYSPQAQIAKNKIHWIKTSRENNWFPSASSLEKKDQIYKKKKYNTNFEFSK